MGKYIVACVLALTSGSILSQVEAEHSIPPPVFFSWGGETMLQVVDFPDTTDFQTEMGEYVDAGVIYRQIIFFSLPVWNYDIRWIGYLGNRYQYLQSDRTALEELARHAGLTLPQEPQLPSWHTHGGKLTLLVGCVFLVLIIQVLVSVSRKSQARKGADGRGD